MSQILQHKIQGAGEHHVNTDWLKCISFSSNSSCGVVFVVTTASGNCFLKNTLFPSCWCSGWCIGACPLGYVWGSSPSNSLSDGGEGSAGGVQGSAASWVWLLSALSVHRRRRQGGMMLGKNGSTGVRPYAEHEKLVLLSVTNTLCYRSTTKKEKTC